MSQGIDVFTAYQTVTDWHSVRGAGIEFAYVKVSDGDEDRADNGWGPAGRAAGIAMGAYHYAQPGDPVAQANRLCDRAIQVGMTDLAPALDLESPFTPGQPAIDFAVAFVRQVRARGLRPCLYANDNMMRTVRGPVKAAVPETWIWVARYGANPSVQYDLWQYSSSGHIPGISASSVDLDQGTIPHNDIMEDDLTPEEHNRLIWLEQAVRTLVNQMTGDPKGDPSFDANMDWIDGHLPGFPNDDGSHHFTLTDFVRRANWDSFQARNGTDAIQETLKGLSASVTLSDDQLAKVATAIVGALPATLAQSVVDEISKRLEGTK